MLEHVGEIERALSDLCSRIRLASSGPSGRPTLSQIIGRKTLEYRLRRIVEVIAGS
jgi:hypothetical protein